MKLLKQCILFLIAMLLSFFCKADVLDVQIQEISFNQSQTVNIGSGSTNVTANVSYYPSDIPQYAQTYINQINSRIDDQLQVYAINQNTIVFIITDNEDTEPRTFVVSGRSANTLTIVQAGAPEPQPEPEADEKLDIQGNWILNRTYTSQDESQYYDDITFYNGLGYPDQIINIGASAAGTNVVTPLVYDAHMRDNAKVYQPYASTGNNIARENSPLAAQQNYYTAKYNSADGARAYSQNIYEASSLGRTVGMRKSGSAYTSKNTSYTYGTNAANEVLCLKVTYPTTGKVSEATLTTSYYPASSLYKTTITDEDGKTGIEFKDKSGNVVLQRNLVSGSTYADTYYSYDHLGKHKIYGNCRRCYLGYSTCCRRRCIFLS